jgi:hypothetical protein
VSWAELVQQQLCFAADQQRMRMCDQQSQAYRQRRGQASRRQASVCVADNEPDKRTEAKSFTCVFVDPDYL